MQLAKVIETAANNCTLISGDFNYPTIGCENLDADNFLDSVTDSFLTQHVSNPTRGTNMLDLVFTTDSGIVNEVQVRQNLENCYHNILKWEIICNAPLCITANRPRYVLHKGNYNRLCSILSGFP